MCFALEFDILRGNSAIETDCKFTGVWQFQKQKSVVRDLEFR